MARGEALSVYRTAIRATRKTFAGNKYMLDVSAAEFRKKFLENRHLTSEADIQKMLQIGRKAAEYVATMIIQSKVGDHFDYDVRGSEQPIEIPNAEGFCAGDKRLGSNMSQVHMAKEIKTCEIAAMGNMLMDNEREGLLGEGRKLLGEGRETASYVVQSKVDDRFHNDLKGAQQPNEIPSVERHCMSEAYKAKEIKTGEIAALEKIQSDNEREDGRNTTHYAINFKVDDGLYYDMKGTEQSTEIPFAGSHHFMRVESPGFGMSHVYMVRGIKTGEIFSLEKIRSENEREGLAEHGRKAANYVIQPLIEEGFNYDNGAGWQNEIPPVESHFRRTGHLGLGISQACMAKQIKTGEIIVSMEIRMGNVCSQAYMAKEIKRGEIAPLKKILMDCGREGRQIELARGETVSAYRTALRATRKAFAGEELMLQDSVSEFREKFTVNRHLTSKALDMGRRVADNVATTIVQSKANDGFDYDVIGSETVFDIPSEESVHQTEERQCFDMSQVYMAKEIKTGEFFASSTKKVDNKRETNEVQINNEREEVATTRGEALSVYRTALRATCKTFAGNETMLQASVAEFRKKFEENRNLTSEADIEKALETGRKAADYVATMIVQSKVNDGFGYDVIGSEPIIEIPTVESVYPTDERRAQMY